MDAVLLQRWVESRDAEAFRALALKYLPMVYGTCVRMLRDAGEAEDVAQECFEALAGIREPAPTYVGPWLHRVATNKCLTLLRKRARRARLSDAATAATLPQPAREYNELYSVIDEAIAQLPDTLRVPLVQHFFENQSHETIAQSLGLTRSAITHRITKAIDQVREDLKRRGFHAVGFGAVLETIRTEPVAVPAAISHAIAKLAIGGGVVGAAPGVGMSAAVALLKGGLLMSSTQKVVVGTLLAVACIVGPLEIYRQTHLSPPGEVSSAEYSEAPSSGEAIDESVSLSRDDRVSTGTRERGGIISGNVVSVHGAPEPGITVHAIQPLKSRDFSAVTDGHGAFEISKIPDGHYEIRLQMPQATVPEPIVRTVVEIVGERNMRGLRIVSGDVGLVIAGRVTDRAGLPIAGARVDAFETFDTGVSTDANGNYRIMDVPSGVYTVTAHAHNKMNATVEYISAGAEGVDIVMSDVAHIRGRVIDDVTGRPVIKFKVTAITSFDPEGVTAELMTDPSALTVSDPRGRFDVPWPREGRVNLIAKGEETATGTAEVEVVADVPPREVEIRVGKGIDIEGSIRGPDRRPVMGARIYYGDIPEPFFGQMSLMARSDTAGKFHLRGLLPGPHWIGITEESGLRKTVEFEVVEGTNRPLEITLDRPGAVEGRVLARGRPVVDALVRSSGSEPAITDLRGSYRIANLEPGKVSIQVNTKNAMRSDLPEWVSNKVIIEPGKTVVLDIDVPLGTGRISGTVIGSVEGTAQVYARWHEGDQRVSVHGLATKDGRYELANVPAGAIDLSCTVRTAGGDNGNSRNHHVDIGENEHVVRDFDFESATGVLVSVPATDKAFYPAVYVYTGNVNAQVTPESWFELNNQLVAGMTVSEMTEAQVLGLEPGAYTVAFVTRNGDERTYRQAFVDLTDGVVSEISLVD